MLFSNPKKIIESLDIKKGDVVADVGSGIGRYSIPLAVKVGNSGIVHAIEVNDDVIERLKSEINDSNEYINNINILRTSIETDISEIQPNSCDWVVCANVFFILEHKKDAINTIKSILKDNGKVALIDWKGSYSGMGPSQEHIFFEEDAVEFFESNNLFLNKRIDSGSHHYGLVFSKKKREKKDSSVDSKIDNNIII